MHRTIDDGILPIVYMPRNTGDGILSNVYCVCLAPLVMVYYLVCIVYLPHITGDGILPIVYCVFASHHW